MNENNRHECPLCGKETNHGETFCEECKAIVQNEYLNGQHREDNNLTESKEDIIKEENTEEAEKTIKEINPQPFSRKPKRKKAIYVFIIGLILLIIAGAVSAYYMRKEKKESKAAEIAFWLNCSDENTTLSYSKYLVRYPEGIFNEEAQSKIYALRHREDSIWNEITTTKNVDKLYTYLNEYPNTIYKKNVRNRIDSLTWEAMKKENTAAAYKAYLDNITIGNYEGKYKEYAKERYDYLIQMEEIEGKELQAIKDRLRSFFRLQTSKRYKELNNVLASPLVNFEGQKNKQPQQIIDSIKLGTEKEKIKMVVYRTGIDSLIVYRDRDSIYHTTFALTKEINYISKQKQKDIVKYCLRVEITPEKQIRTIYQVKNK